MKISDEEIYNLREQGLAYRAIAEYFTDKEETVSLDLIRRICKRIYNENGKKEPRAKVESIKGITDEEIYNLREQGLAYEAIAEYFISQGKNISHQAINNRCKRIYGEKRRKEPKAKTKPITGITDEEIYILREQGLSCEVISKYFTDQGKEINKSSVYSRCKKIYEENGKEKPKTKTKSKTGITDEEIYNLREQRLSYEVIAQYFTLEGKKISWRAIYSRCKRIYEEKGQEEPKVKPQQKSKRSNEKKQNLGENINNKDLPKAIMNLIVTRKATLEQIKKIAEIYEVDLEEVFDNYIDAR